MKTVNKVLLGIVSSLALAGCTDEREPAEPAVDIDAGRSLVEANCSACHGDDGQDPDSQGKS